MNQVICENGDCSWWKGNIPSEQGREHAQTHIIMKPVETCLLLKEVRQSKLYLLSLLVKALTKHQSDIQCELLKEMGYQILILNTVCKKITKIKVHC